MNVNSVSPISCKANASKFAKQFNIPMKDGSETIIKLTDNSIDCLMHKEGRVLGGYGHKAPDGILVDEVLDVYENSLASNIKEGFNFLKEFLDALSK